MSTLVELISPTDTIAFEATPNPGGLGFVYDNVTLEKWYELPAVAPRISKRPNANGAYGLGKIFTKEHTPIVAGQFFGASSLDALIARNRLNALFSDGESITMRVTDELGSTSRTVWLLESTNKFRYDFSHFPLDISLVAPDPRRYGSTVSSSDGMPTSGSGLVWNLGTAPSGLYWDWGTVGIAGRVQLTNTGSTTTFPRVEVGGAGGFDAGFRVTEVETGRALTFIRATNLGEVVVFDSRTERATLASGDVTAFLSSRGWFSIPAGATRQYQINPLGATSGNPTITAYADPAFM